MQIGLGNVSQKTIDNYLRKQQMRYFEIYDFSFIHTIFSTPNGSQKTPKQRTYHQTSQHDPTIITVQTGIINGDSPNHLKINHVSNINSQLQVAAPEPRHCKVRPSR